MRGLLRPGKRGLSRLFLGIVGAAAFASPGVAQVAATSSVGQAVANTAQQHMNNIVAGGGAWPSADQAAELSAMNSQLASDLSPYQSSCTTSCGWFPWIISKLQQGLHYASGSRSDPQGRFPDDATPYSGGGSFGGGGAGGSWTDSRNAPCADFVYHLDQLGRLYIPTMPLQPGVSFTKTTPKTQAFSVYGYTNHTFTATSTEAAALWTMHLMNKSLYPKPVWMGPWGTHVLNGVLFVDHCQPKEYIGSSLQGGPCSAIGDFNQDPYYGGSFGTDCPPGGTASGTFDFYGDDYNGGQTWTCIEYSPNPQIGKEGYAMPQETVIPAGMEKHFPNGLGSWVKACNISPELIRQITDKLMDEVAANGGHAKGSPVSSDEVRSGGFDPQLADLDASPSVPQSSSNSPPPGGGTQNPPPTTGGEGCEFTAGCDDPGVTASDPTAPTDSSVMDPVLNWFPSIPSLSLNISGATCPTWTAHPFTWTLTMDKQCEFAEQNRAAIGALMTVVWAIGAAVIILRA